MTNQDQPNIRSLKRKLSSRFSLTLVILLFSVIGTLMLFRSDAEITTGELYISPAASSLNVGENVEVEIRLNPGSTVVDGVEAELTYDQSILEFVSVNGSGSPFELALGSQTGGSGKVNVARGTLQGGVSADVLVAKIVFKALASSTDNQIQITGNAASQGAYTNPVTAGAAVTVTQTQSGTMSLTPALPSVDQGASFTLEIRLNPGGPVQGAEAQLTYDQAKLEFVRIDASESGFDLALGSQNGGNGKVNISRGTLSGSISSEALVAKVEFKALAGSGISVVELAGNAAYEGVYTNPTTSDATVAFNSLSATEPTAVITKPTDGAVVSIDFSVSVNANDDEGVTKVELYVDGNLYDTVTQTPYNFTVDTSSLDNGEHSLQAKAYDSSGNVGNSQIVSFKVNSWAEDINNDGVVNLLDFSLLSFKFGQSGVELGREDINFDGLIDMLDFNLLFKKFRLRLF